MIRADASSDASCLVFAALRNARRRLRRTRTRKAIPTRPVTIITPFAAGSVTDATARSIAAHLQEALGQPFIVENRAGAGGMPAASAVAQGCA